MNRHVHVAVGVVKNNCGHILIAKRPQESHQGGLWEFPGGKVETGESVLDALKREFKEEVNLKLHSAKALMDITHDYGDKKVLLDVWLCSDFSGEASGVEGQVIQWIAPEQLTDYQFPEANQTIIERLLSNP